MNTKFIKGYVVAAIAVALTGLSLSFKDGESSKPKEKAPNILYIMCDDLTMQAIGAYGSIYKDIVPTPNMDRLANEGMLFQNVLVTNAICGPSRACILTGKYSHTNGYYKNEYGGVFNEKQWTFPQEFQKNGYDTSLFGKWHLGTQPVGFSSYKYHVSSGQQGLYWNPTYNENGKEIQEKGYCTNITTQFALDWLDKERDKSKPFLMLLQYKAPHRPWDPDTKYLHMWDNVEFPYPSTFNDDYKGRELTAGDTEMTMDYFSRRDMKMKAPENLKGKDKIAWEFYGAKKGEIVQPEGMTAEEGKKWRYQNYVRGYMGCVKSVDDNLGKVLEYLDRNNLSENTMIVLTSDQGFYMGEHGFFDKRFIYEESLRMPFIVKFPKKIKAGTVNKDIVSNIDFAPTFLEIAGIKSKEKVQGRSFASIISNNNQLKNPKKAVYYHYYEFPYWHHVQPHYGIRTERYTLAHFYYNIDKWELYDLQKDPHQMNNIINDPSYSKTVADLKIQLKKLMKEAGNDKSLAEFRTITDKDFGSLVKKGDESEDVNHIINNKK